ALLARRALHAGAPVSPSPEQMRALIEAHTEIARPPLCPELRLHLVTERCALWRAGEDELAALGLPPPYWAFCWAGGQALARYLLDHPDAVHGRNVLDFGAGGGVEALAAARAGASAVLASDIDPFAVQALEMNAALNDVRLTATSRDLLGLDEGWDVVLAGDVCYDRALAGQVQAWLERLAARGADVLVGDPRRGYLDESRLSRIAELDAPSDVDVEGRYLRRTGIFRVLG
ncbi:MAG: class I SAM-dependent methyltransferase, partial [Myxococcales bacterium]